MTLEIDKKEVEEKRIRAKSGMGILILLLLLMAVSIAAAVFGILFPARERFALGGILLGAGVLFSCVIGPILFAGLKILKPNEALVLTLFGKYYSTLTGPGFFYVCEKAEKEFYHSRKRGRRRIKTAPKRISFWSGSHTGAAGTETFPARHKKRKSRLEPFDFVKS